MAVKLYKFKINFKLDIKQANQLQKKPHKFQRNV